MLKILSIEQKFINFCVLLNFRNKKKAAVFRSFSLRQLHFIL